MHVYILVLFDVCDGETDGIPFGVFSKKMNCVGGLAHINACNAFYLVNLNIYLVR